MKKKLDTRFPAARIKKVMQSDEDVGKMAMAVPLLVSKALELFLQDLCDRTYEVTLTRGAKTITSSHLKQCVRSTNVFDFLKEIVSKVSDLGGSASGRDDQLLARRRKLADYEDDNVEDTKRIKSHATGHTYSSGRGRGRDRGRGRGQGTRVVAGDKFEDDPDMHGMQAQMLFDRGDSLEFKDNSLPLENAEAPVRNFDLNLDLDEDGNAASVLAWELDNTSSESIKETTPDEQPRWARSEMETIAIDAVQLACFNQLIEEDENYDEE